MFGNGLHFFKMSDSGTPQTWGDTLTEGASNDGVNGVLEPASGFVGLSDASNYFVMDNPFFIDFLGTIYLEYLRSSGILLLGANIVTVDKQLHFNNIQTYPNNASAVLGGLLVGDIYKTAAGELRIVV